MVLVELPVPGRPTILITVGQGPTALAVGAGGGCLDIFTLLYPFSPLSPSLWETARYRLKYCLKGPLNPKQPTGQPNLCLQIFKCHKLQPHREIESVTLTMQNSYHTTTVHNGETIKTERIYAETRKSQVSFQIVQCYASNQ